MPQVLTIPAAEAEFPAPDQTPLDGPIDAAGNPILGDAEPAPAEAPAEAPADEPKPKPVKPRKPRVADIRAAVAAAGQAQPGADAPPVEVAATEPVSAEPVSESTGPRKYRVSLPHNPTLDVEASDRDDAIEKYNAACGIIFSPHRYTVDRIAD
jgi:hypothetical protein